MDCLVTGGAGFIGSNIVDALLVRGDRVTVLDDLSSGKLANLEGALAAGAQFVRADIRDAAAVADAFAQARPQTVFHLAAQIDVRRSVQDPVHDATVNVLGALTVLQASLESGVRRFVNTSTGGGLYGDADVLPTPEDSPIRALAPYGTSKQSVENYVALFDRLHGLSSVTLRYGNVYGPRQDVHGEAGVVAIFCGLAMTGGTPTVFGDGRQTRDWVDVSDVVRANLLAADCDVTGPINIGHGEETSVLELIAALDAVAIPGLAPPVFADARAGEVARSCLDVRRAHELLGWRATVGLREGLQRILQGLGAEIRAAA